MSSPLHSNTDPSHEGERHCTVDENTNGTQGSCSERSEGGTPLAVHAIARGDKCGSGGGGEENTDSEGGSEYNGTGTRGSRDARHCVVLHYSQDSFLFSSSGVAGHVGSDGGGKGGVRLSPRVIDNTSSHSSFSDSSFPSSSPPSDAAETGRRGKSSSARSSEVEEETYYDDDTFEDESTAVEDDNSEAKSLPPPASAAAAAAAKEMAVRSERALLLRVYGAWCRRAFGRLAAASDTENEDLARDEREARRNVKERRAGGPNRTDDQNNANLGVNDLQEEEGELVRNHTATSTHSSSGESFNEDGGEGKEEESLSLASTSPESAKRRPGRHGSPSPSVDPPAEGVWAPHTAAVDTGTETPAPSPPPAAIPVGREGRRSEGGATERAASSSVTATTCSVPPHCRRSATQRPEPSSASPGSDTDRDAGKNDGRETGSVEMIQSTHQQESQSVPGHKNSSSSDDQRRRLPPLMSAEVKGYMAVTLDSPDAFPSPAQDLEVQRTRVNWRARPSSSSPCSRSVPSPSARRRLTAAHSTSSSSSSSSSNSDSVATSGSDSSASDATHHHRRHRASRHVTNASRSPCSTALPRTTSLLRALRHRHRYCDPSLSGSAAPSSFLPPTTTSAAAPPSIVTERATNTTAPEVGSTTGGTGGYERHSSFSSSSSSESSSSSSFSPQRRVDSPAVASAACESIQQSAGLPSEIAAATDDEDADGSAAAAAAPAAASLPSRRSSASLPASLTGDSGEDCGGGAGVPLRVSPGSRETSSGSGTKSSASSRRSDSSARILPCAARQQQQQQAQQQEKRNGGSQRPLGSQSRSPPQQQQQGLPPPAPVPAARRLSPSPSPSPSAPVSAPHTTPTTTTSTSTTPTTRTSASYSSAAVAGASTEAITAPPPAAPNATFAAMLEETRREAQDARRHPYDVQCTDNSPSGISRPQGRDTRPTATTAPLNSFFPVSVPLPRHPFASLAARTHVRRSLSPQTAVAVTQTPVAEEEMKVEERERETPPATQDPARQSVSANTQTDSWAPPPPSSLPVRSFSAEGGAWQLTAPAAGAGTTALTTTAIEKPPTRSIGTRISQDDRRLMELMAEAETREEMGALGGPFGPAVATATQLFHPPLHLRVVDVGTSMTASSGTSLGDDSGDSGGVQRASPALVMSSLSSRASAPDPALSVDTTNTAAAAAAAVLPAPQIRNTADAISSPVDWGFRELGTQTSPLQPSPQRQQQQQHTVSQVASPDTTEADASTRGEWTEPLTHTLRDLHAAAACVLRRAEALPAGAGATASVSDQATAPTSLPPPLPPPVVVNNHNNVSVHPFCPCAGSGAACGDGKSRESHVQNASHAAAFATTPHVPSDPAAAVSTTDYSPTLPAATSHVRNVVVTVSVYGGRHRTHSHHRHGDTRALPISSSSSSSSTTSSVNGGDRNSDTSPPSSSSSSSSSSLSSCDTGEEGEARERSTSAVRVKGVVPKPKGKPIPPDVENVHTAGVSAPPPATVRRPHSDGDEEGNDEYYEDHHPHHSQDGHDDAYGDELGRRTESTCSSVRSAVALAVARAQERRRQIQQEKDRLQDEIEAQARQRLRQELHRTSVEDRGGKRQQDATGAPLSARQHIVYNYRNDSPRYGTAVAHPSLPSRPEGFGNDEVYRSRWPSPPVPVQSRHPSPAAVANVGVFSGVAVGGDRSGTGGRYDAIHTEGGGRGGGYDYSYRDDAESERGRGQDRNRVDDTRSDSTTSTSLSDPSFRGLPGASYRRDSRAPGGFVRVADPSAREGTARCAAGHCDRETPVYYVCDPAHGASAHHLKSRHCHSHEGHNGCPEHAGAARAAAIAPPSRHRRRCSPHGGHPRPFSSSPARRANTDAAPAAAATTTTAGAAPRLLTGRVNPYCLVCRARYNLIVVDPSMRPMPAATATTAATHCTQPYGTRLAQQQQQQQWNPTRGGMIPSHTSSFSSVHCSADAVAAAEEQQQCNTSPLLHIQNSRRALDPPREMHEGGGDGSGALPGPWEAALARELRRHLCGLAAAPGELTGGRGGREWEARMRTLQLTAGLLGRLQQQ